MSQDSVPEDVQATIQQEYKILAEYKMVASEKVGGIYVIPSFANSLLWYGVIFVRQGIYEEGIFRFNISLPDKFPDDKTVPTVIFQNEMYHPLICPFTGTLDLSQAFPLWRCGEDHIWQLLKYLQAIFIDPVECLRTPTSSTTKWPNSEAAELLMQNRAGFIAKVKECIDSNKEHLYDEPPTDDPHYIAFEQFNEEVHGPVKERIREGKEPILTNTTTSVAASSSGAKGLSWVKEGEYAPLSAE
ncbi:ubiquitin E2 variant domain-containing protein pendolino isoform X1 [Musca autumnalis]|uniref:ubiquitin E2 variant domain-containing protein pendolino isoform X1 n=1 Tax=Musca autumnalis TaxID=221902 RepID=UPI003CFB0AC5